MRSLVISLAALALCLLANDAQAFHGRRAVVVNAPGASVAVRGGLFGPRVVVNGGGFVQPAFVSPRVFVAPPVVVPGAFGVQSFNTFGGGCGGAVIAPSVSGFSQSSVLTFGY